MGGWTENEVLGVETSTRGERGRPCSYGWVAGMRGIGIGSARSAERSAPDRGKRSGAEKDEAEETMLVSIVVSAMLMALVSAVAPVERNDLSVVLLLPNVPKFMLFRSPAAEYGVLGSGKPAARETSPYSCFWRDCSSCPSAL